MRNIGGEMPIAFVESTLFTRTGIIYLLSIDL